VFLSGSEFAVLLDHIPGYWRPLVTFLYSTGTRWGEATALKIKDVDLASTPPQFAVVASWKHTDGRGHDLGPPKTEKGRRSIGLTPQMVALLLPVIGARARVDYVFVNRQGRPVLHNSFHSRVWAPAAAAAEPTIHKHPRIHDCRHSAASNMIQQGVPLNVVQQILGHESIRTTVDVYGHTAGNALSIAAQAAAMSLVEAYPELEQ
jgi:integrase